MLRAVIAVFKTLAPMNFQACVIWRTAGCQKVIAIRWLCADNATRDSSWCLDSKLAFECKYFIDCGDAEQNKLLETPAKRHNDTVWSGWWVRNFHRNILPALTSHYAHIIKAAVILRNVGACVAAFSATGGAQRKTRMLSVGCSRLSVCRFVAWCQLLDFSLDFHETR